MDKSGRDYFKDPDFRITSEDVIPSSEMQIDPLRIDIDLARFLLMGREFFWVGRELLAGEEIFCGSRIFSPVENFFWQSRIFYRFNSFCSTEGFSVLESFCR